MRPISSSGLTAALFLSGFVAAVATAAKPARDYPIQPVPFTNVKVTGGFWYDRLETNREVTVDYCFEKCEETGRIANFARAGGLEEGGFQGIYFNDSDVVKVIEGAAYCLMLKDDPRLEKYLDNLIAKIAAAQEDDGYLYTARTIGDPHHNYPGKEGRWSHCGHGHELYNVGHMYEAAVAHYQATGKRTLLDVAIKNADLVCKMFGPEEGQVVDVPGHQEIEIGLVKLYRATGNEKYLKQAKFFIDMRGREDKRGKIYGTHSQDHKPLVEQTEAVGHAVRGGYFYAGVADVTALTGDADYLAAIDRIWQDVLDKKIYITGNVGQHGAGEGYAGPYQLGNLKAYNETCAAIALALWNHRMFLLHGDAQYIDVLERTLYNGFLSGVSLSGDKFFYPNPLACDMQFKFNHGSLQRKDWFGCSCCPVNVVRFLPSMPGMVYAQRDDTIYVNLFVEGQSQIELSGRTVTLKQETNYPWDGKVKLTVTPEQAGELELRVRIPGWALNRPLPGKLYTVLQGDKLEWEPSWKVNGEAQTGRLEQGYAVIHRVWKAGDTVELDLPLAAQRVLCDARVEPNRGRTAVIRGPVDYCVEGADNGGKVMDVFLPDDAMVKSEFRGDLLGGVTVLTGEAKRVRRTEEGSVASESAKITMIPYYAWCHRGANEMQVWLPRSADLAKPGPMPTIASQSKVTASHCWHADTVTALNDQQQPRSSNDGSIPRLTFWGHTGTSEWVQYDFAEPRKVSQVSVYWYDDTGAGRCRTPESWAVLYRDGSAWKPVVTDDDFAMLRDCYNTVSFRSVKTDALRIQTQLQSDYSAGILEWRVK